MSDTEHEYGLRQVRLAAERQLKKATERLHQHIQHKTKHSPQQNLPTATPVPRLTMRLTPMSHTGLIKPLTKADILRSSKNLRNTHLPNDLALALLQTPPSNQFEQNKKLLATSESFKKRWQIRQHYLKYAAAEETYQHEHEQTLSL